jgi:hypothetical protein
MVQGVFSLKFLARPLRSCGRAALVTVFCLVPALLAAQDTPKPRSVLAQQLEAATERAAAQEYELRYKFRVGEVIRTNVVHLATTETTIQGNTQESKSRSSSTKVWKITEVSDEGVITFEHSVEKIDMWQQVTGRDEIKYNSEIDEKAPPEYQPAAETVGVTLAVVSVDSSGEVLSRHDDKPAFHFGLGQITTPLPKQKVKIGDQWTFPTEIVVALPSRQVKRIKTQQLFTLVSVKTGVATISVRTQVLTPINDPKIESQLVQQLTNGTIRFDIDAGRILTRQMDWDETVVAFNGADSSLKYLARYTEDYVPAVKEVASKP